MKQITKSWISGILIFTLSLGMAFAQNSQIVNGVVVDESGNPLQNATIMVKGTQQRVSSDANGKFAIQAANGKTIIISYVGRVTNEMLVTGNAMRVTLKEEISTLEEVVSIGYTRLRKSDLTGAVSSVKARELNLSTPTLSQALVGKVAGVQVSQVSGAPYSGAKIRVRGIGSINASSEPLYVIDGYAVGGNPSQGQGNGGNGTGGYNPATNGNDIFINPDDFESIEVLKDAASAAIYGSRAAAGVILITTKRGKQGKGTVEYDYQYSVQQLSNKVKLLNASEFADLFVEGRNTNYKDILVSKNILWDNSFYSDDNATRIVKAGQTATGCSVCIPKYLYDNASQKIIAPAYNTDWQDVLYGNAAVQRHNISFSGSSNNTRYFISGGYLDQPGILNSTYQKRINVRANIDADITEKLKTSASFFVTNTKNREVQEGRFNQGPILGALVYMPIFPAYNPDGTLATADKGAGAQTDGFGYAFQGIENPLALAQRVNITRNGLRGTYSLATTYEVVKDVFAKVNLGGSTYNEKYEYYYPTNLSNGINPPGSAQSVLAANSSAQTLSSQDLLAEFTLNYRKNFRKNRFDFLAGYTAQQTNTDIIAVASKNYTNDLIPEITAGGSVPG
ncbi:MAG: SusC/RagA family TonB-linked outer membrane protein, partial [Chitinophagia bacterium]|nr:SusC/RagA family TonB-linked outer membrane protein [Chitinophagia bacterium]